MMRTVTGDEGKITLRLRDLAELARALAFVSAAVRAAVAALLRSAVSVASLSAFALASAAAFDLVSASAAAFSAAAN